MNARERARRRALIALIDLAAEDEDEKAERLGAATEPPGLRWQRIADTVLQMTRSYRPRVTRAEIDALRQVTIGELYAGDETSPSKENWDGPGGKWERGDWS